MKFLALLSLVAATTAAPAALEARGATTCGSTYYSASQVTAASNAACDYVQSGTTAGGSTYPHEYHNYEGFYFKGLSGPFYEFPLRTSGVYSGGSPGADRVVITESCEEAGQITHTGASGGGFVACSGTS
ncbi:extracellular guanyl-specific ribonuclease [Trichophyton mentagrophytes]|uniref:ribonuclease T1 n=3 Tax=Trichophyton TaxID=5550 RepID=A0A059JFS4_TRIIM|nr:ribonuclease F1 [Trichophyton tonsurans CBS 112818]EGE01738.1 guanyl-specific ribonuclease F1 [Trichophyton equinum CBS 127.97]EZF33499.1 guanyl-specific ribonuclease Th1 [Trichophyton interdigitale H6]KDB26644.1 guanyl-specific ribonuclease Th1 [Trichophyton interdigitale MR816]GBF62815.1 extracellular guanyl-specific ribonuclease [Trichophyton mentagrophytes]